MTFALLPLLLLPATAAPRDTTPPQVPVERPAPAEMSPPVPPDAPRRRWLAPDERLSVHVSVSAPLRRRSAVDVLGERFQGEQVQNLALQTGLRYAPRAPWVATFTHYAFLRPQQQRPWDPDFSYTVGYEDYRPGTLSVVYANYGGNRLRPDRSRGERVTRLDEGSVTAAYRFVLPRHLERLFVPNPGGRIVHTLTYSVVPRFTTDDGGTGRLKHRLGLATRYAIAGPLYAEATAHVYPKADQQQPWDPDYVYGFGYADYGSGRVSLQYANHSGTRYPWRPRTPGTGGFRDGGLSLSWLYAF